MMGYEEKRVRALLKEHDAVLSRRSKHEIWKLTCGLIVLPSTPSDHRAWKNALSFLHNTLGLNEVNRGTPGERRERGTTPFTRPTPLTPLEAPPMASMSSQMRGLHPGNLRVIGAVPRKTIKHPVRRAVAPVKDISVDISGLLNKFGRG